MLKKIPVTHARLGMHLHALEGAWLSHPFWKMRFVLDDPQDLVRLQTSGVTEIWIDVARGLDVATVYAEDGAGPLRSDRATATSARVSAHGPVLDVVQPPPATASLGDEMQQAAAICRRGREQVVRMFGEARLGRAVDAEECLPLVEDIAASVMRNPAALVSLARLKTRDDYTYLHSMAVCALMVALARQLGMDGERCRAAGLAGLLHDLGKAGVPDEVLNKPGELTDAERSVIRTHPLLGHAMLSEARGATVEALDVCLSHHERVDGAGYPGGLAGADLSLFARMGAVCDVYDAVTSHRPYEAAWDPAESIARMASWKGCFDGEVFHAFVRSLGIYPIGSLVRMRSQQVAIVVEQNPDALVTPVVKTFYSLRLQMPVGPRVLDLSRSDCNDRIVGREPPGSWAGVDLDGLWAGEAARRRHR